MVGGGGPGAEVPTRRAREQGEGSEVAWSGRRRPGRRVRRNQTAEDGIGAAFVLCGDDGVRCSARLCVCRWARPQGYLFKALQSSFRLAWPNLLARQTHQRRLVLLPAARLALQAARAEPNP